MRLLNITYLLTIACLLCIGACSDSTETCEEATWYEDADSDGLGNPDVIIESCNQPNGFVSNDSDDDDSGDVSNIGSTPISAFDDFNSDAVTISFNSDEVTIESNGLIDHSSPYWDVDNALYINPVVAESNQMSPGVIRERAYSLTVPLSPQIAANTSSTGLGAIGIAVTGAPIFNEQEGPNISLSDQVASGFDYAGGHMGPQGYHYHLESQDVEENTNLSHDDDKLVGILSDGFLLYGRKCNSTGDYPSDLDNSGGHNSSTQHSSDETFYHYHIINEIYLNKYILLFGVDYKGSPNGIM